MKRITFIRHAKSSSDDTSLSDHDRPLNHRGKQDAPKMGHFLREHDIVFDAIYSSTALRALTTARNIASSVGYNNEIIELKELYFTWWFDEIVQHISSQDDSCESIAIFGHNDTFRQIVMILSQWQVREFPTCACASFLYNCPNWSDIDTRTLPGLDIFMTPKAL